MSYIYFCVVIRKEEKTGKNKKGKEEKTSKKKRGKDNIKRKRERGGEKWERRKTLGSRSSSPYSSQFHHFLLEEGEFLVSCSLGGGGDLDTWEF